MNCKNLTNISCMYAIDVQRIYLQINMWNQDTDETFLKIAEYGVNKKDMCRLTTARGRRWLDDMVTSL